MLRSILEEILSLFRAEIFLKSTEHISYVQKNIIQPHSFPLLSAAVTIIPIAPSHAEMHMSSPHAP